MSAAEMIHTLAAEGYRLSLQDDGQSIKIDAAPGQTVSPDLVERLRTWKPQLIAFLKAQPSALSEAERDATFTLLRNLALKGFLLRLDDHESDQVEIDSDREVPPELLERLKERKPAILAVLKAQARAAELLKARDDIATCTRSVCIETLWGRVWIGPQRTGAARVEVTWGEIHEDPWGAVERCHQLAAAIDLFDGKLIVDQQVEQHVEQQVENDAAKNAENSEAKS